MTESEKRKNNPIATWERMDFYQRFFEHFNEIPIPIINDRGSKEYMYIERMIHFLIEFPNEVEKQYKRYKILFTHNKTINADNWRYLDAFMFTALNIAKG